MAGRLLLLLHLSAVILWLGTHLGALWMYRAARREGLGARALPWLERTLRLAHAAFVGLVAAGVALMIHHRIWPPPDWLLWKLVLVGTIAVPVESADFYLLHFWIPADLAGPSPERAQAHFDRWLRLSSPLLLLAALATLALAVLKP